MQFGPSLFGKNIVKLVKGTKLRETLELNRMAFADWLPRNSESRAIGVAMRMVRARYGHIKWVVSYADGCQCGDGAIYRAAGFLLTDIRRNTGLRVDPVDGKVKHCISAYHEKRRDEFKDWTALDGFMLRYIYFLHPEERKNLVVEVLPYSRIGELGAGMYKGKKRAGSIGDDAPGDQPGEGGSTPTPALQNV